VKEKKKSLITRRKRYWRETVHTQRILYIRRSSRYRWGNIFIFTTTVIFV
jgi:hypothetical protein